MLNFLQSGQKKLSRSFEECIPWKITGKTYFMNDLSLC